MKKLLFFLLFVAAATLAQAQPNPKPRTSPLALAAYKHTDSVKTNNSQYIKVVYGQPYKREREVFGSLVPYGQVWRTGANEATEITVLREVTVGDKKLKPGTYTLFTIPNADKWTVIFNRELGQWGAYSYNPKQNELSVDVSAAKASEVYEAFTIRFSERPDGTDMLLLWDQTQVTVPFRFKK